MLNPPWTRPLSPGPGAGLGGGAKPPLDPPPFPWTGAGLGGTSPPKTRPPFPCPLPCLVSLLPSNVKPLTHAPLTQPPWEGVGVGKEGKPHASTVRRYLVADCLACLRTVQSLDLPFSPSPLPGREGTGLGCLSGYPLQALRSWASTPPPHPPPPARGRGGGGGGFGLAVTPFANMMTRHLATLRALIPPY